MSELTKTIGANLFAESGARVFAILDGASAPGLLSKLDEYRPEYECLYRGELAPDLQEVAPYLVQLEPQSPFTDWVLNRGWGTTGVFSRSHWTTCLCCGVISASSSSSMTARVRRCTSATMTHAFFVFICPPAHQKN